MTNLSFSAALLALKNGRTVKRAHWLGQSAISLSPGSYDGSLPQDPQIDGIAIEHFVAADTGSVTRFPSFSLRTSLGNTMQGWTPTTHDLLAEDWQLV